MLPSCPFLLSLLGHIAVDRGTWLSLIKVFFFFFNVLLFSCQWYDLLTSFDC